MPWFDCCSGLKAFVRHRFWQPRAEGDGFDTPEHLRYRTLQSMQCLIGLIEQLCQLREESLDVMRPSGFSDIPEVMYEVKDDYILEVARGVIVDHNGWHEQAFIDKLEQLFGFELSAQERSKAMQSVHCLVKRGRLEIGVLSKNKDKARRRGHGRP